MHELSLVQGLFSQVRVVAKENNAQKVLRVLVEIGPFSGVVVDSFCFAFDALKKGDKLLQDAVLEIKTPPAGFRCPNCLWEEEPNEANKKNTDTDEMFSSALGMLTKTCCPHCGEEGLLPLGSDDILLLQIEME